MSIFTHVCRYNYFYFPLHLNLRINAPIAIANYYHYCYAILYHYYALRYDRGNQTTSTRTSSFSPLPSPRRGSFYRNNGSSEEGWTGVPTAGEAKQDASVALTAFIDFIAFLLPLLPNCFLLLFIAFISFAKGELISIESFMELSLYKWLIPCQVNE
jgi:hypothetical protein